MIEALTAGVSKVYTPAIRASREWGKRPTAVIMRDDWYGHRDGLTGEPRGDRDEWIDWDHLLADAYQTIESYSDQYGIPKWIHDTPWIGFDAKREVHKFDAARDMKTNAKNYKAEPGEMFLPEKYSTMSSKVDEHGNIQAWTFREWIESQVENDE